MPPGQRLHGGPVPAGTGRAVDGRPGRLRAAVPPTAGDAAAQAVNNLPGVAVTGAGRLKKVATKGLASFF